MRSRVEAGFPSSAARRFGSARFSQWRRSSQFLRQLGFSNRLRPFLGAVADLAKHYSRRGALHHRFTAPGTKNRNIDVELVGQSRVAELNDEAIVRLRFLQRPANCLLGFVGIA